jgi:hypothetical protein
VSSLLVRSSGGKHGDASTTTLDLKGNTLMVTSETAVFSAQGKPGGDGGLTDTRRGAAADANFVLTSGIGTGTLNPDSIGIGTNGVTRRQGRRTRRR